MHPEIAKTLAAQHREELMHSAPSAHRPYRRYRLPRWRVSWTRTVLTPARTSQRGSSLVIIISAHRSG